MEFEVRYMVMLKVSAMERVVERIGKAWQDEPEILFGPLRCSPKVGKDAYSGTSRQKLSQGFTILFHVSNMKKCYLTNYLAMPIGRHSL
ncbi:hypothetical protein Tco_0451795 [Tanacetum coccineum]